MIKLVAIQDEDDPQIGLYKYFVEKAGRNIGIIGLFRSRTGDLEIDFLDGDFSAEGAGQILREVKRIGGN